MIVVRLQGRLGNQMFQYALAKSLQNRGKEVMIDSSMLKYDGNYNELGLFPNVKREMQEASSELVQTLGDCNKSILHKIKRKVLGYKKTHILEKGYSFYGDIFEMDNVYLEGYWQSEKYFQSVEKEIRNLYNFPEIEDDINIYLKKEIQDSNSISLHIRRGDYLDTKNAPKHGNICTKQYYENAIDYMEKHVDNPAFFVFTDDPEWAKREYQDKKNIVFVDNNHGENSYRDMQLMSLCKHNIIANSSFSWWGAWLNQTPAKIVVAPPRWFNIGTMPDIICKNWIIVPN